MYVCNINTSCILFNHFYITDPYGSPDVTTIELVPSLFLLIYQSN